MENVYVINGMRTAIGALGGSLSTVPATDLGALTLKEVIKKSEIKPEWINEVYFGCALTAGLGQNIARQVAIKAGLPIDIPASTVGMVCGSGMKSVIDGIRTIRSGDAEIIAVGGCENMSASPYVVPSARWGARMNSTIMLDSMINDGLWDAFNNYHMGITAENVADKWNLSREELDTFALESQNKARKAIKDGKFKDEIVPIEVKQKKKSMIFDTDEYPKETSMEKLSNLKPAFKKDGQVTAGNASGLNDGAAALIIASESAVKKYKLKPMAKIIGWGEAGVDPAIMGIGPVDASKNALRRANISLEDLDLIEANEAFASQAIAVVRELGLDINKVNVNGGAIALGHPIGASGARIIVTLLHEMEKRSDAKVGLATLCIGGGMGVATVFEKCEHVMEEK